MSIVFHGPVAVRSGYGAMARGMALALARLRPGLVVADLRDFPGGRLRTLPELPFLCGDPPPDRPWLRLDVPWRRKYLTASGAPSFLYTMFEAGPLPGAWVEAMAEHDALVVPSRYCAEMFETAGCHNVAVVAPGVGPHFSPEAPPLQCATRSVVFLFLGEFTHRKGVDIALRAFARAFDGDDDVTLLFKTWSSTMAPSDVEKAVRERMRDRASSSPHVVFLHAMLPDELLPSLYTASTALLMPSRSEAFGLPAAEAAACGVAVIATDGTGLSEATQEPFSFPVRAIGMRPAKSTGLPWDFYGGRLMPEPDEDSVVDILRHIYHHPQLARSKGRAAGFSPHRRWRDTALDLLQLIEGGVMDEWKQREPPAIQSSSPRNDGEAAGSRAAQ